MKQYDYLIIGAGLFGATFAHQAKQAGYKCLVIDKRPHIGGNVYCERIRDINVHKYGAHIFHTSDKEVWKYVNDLAEFNRYTNSPLANYKGELFNLPFNMNTFYELWGVTTPAAAQQKIREQRGEVAMKEPRNLEEQAISLVGRDIYEKLIKGYTEKQWGRKCSDLPAFIIRRLPVRLTFDNNYFDDLYQGIPMGGYNRLVGKMLEGVEVWLNVNLFEGKEELYSLAKRVVYTGPIDAYYNYRFGKLAYRTLRFETELLEGVENYQGNAVVNYTDVSVPYTRIIEHKHFEYGSQSSTVITKEYPFEWEENSEPYYPINDNVNNLLYEQYRSLASLESKVVFGGRLAEYKYYNMDQVIKRALECFRKECVLR